MNWLVELGIYGSVASILSIFLYFRNTLLSKGTVRKSIFWLFDKSFFVKMKSNKRYSYFNYNIQDIKATLVECSKRYNKRISFMRTGKNYIEILYEKMQAPLYISFEPVFEDTEHENNELPQELEVSIKILGEIEFRYRNDYNNKLYIQLMESVYKLIEKECGNVTANYENYNIDSTPSDFIEDWADSKSEKSNDSSIYIGNKVVQIHTRRLSSLYDNFRANRLRYQNTSLFLNLSMHRA